jgi:dGTPase
LADRIAYNCHDLEDAIGAGFVTLEILKDVRFWQSAYQQVRSKHEVSHVFAIRRAVLDTILGTLLQDIMETSRPALAKLGSPQEVRAAAAPAPVVRLSDHAKSDLIQLESFLLDHVYRHHLVEKMDDEGRLMVRALFGFYRSNPNALPERFAARIAVQGIHRVVCDYIAGMTDRFCKAEHDRLVGKP